MTQLIAFEPARTPAAARSLLVMVLLACWR